MFTGLQALVAQIFRSSDPEYADSCLAAGIRCWEASGGKDRCWPVSTLCESTRELSWWTVAAVELFRATGREIFRATAEYLGEQLLARQMREFVGGQKEIRGYWLASSGAATPSLSAMPGFALLELLALWPEHAQAGRWRDAVRMHLEECILPLCARSAYRQLEWVMGANPFGACLMTGEGMRNPYPHSRFVGLIPGGLPNGIAGDRNDEPVLDTELGFDWRTVEYCTPHNAHYIWAVSELES
jgi:hypothetical protein